MSDKAQRIVLWTVAILLVVGTSLALRYARGYRPLAGLGPAGSPFPGSVGIRLHGIQVVGRHQGTAAWTLKAGRVETTRARNRIDFSGGIVATLLPVQGRPAAALTAPSATYDNLARALRLSGDVVCTLRDLRVTASSLVWDAGSNVVLCPGAVRATHPRGAVDGDGLTINIRTREYSVRNVRARFPVNSIEDLPL